MKLTDKQQRFCEEYLVDLNATQAAIRAGYKQKTAYSQGQRLLKNVEIQQHMAELMNKRSERTGINADFVVEELYKVAKADVELKGSDKLKALELLGKHLGLFGQFVINEGEAELPALYAALSEGDS